jgi:hypothetical protein
MLFKLEQRDFKKFFETLTELQKNIQMNSQNFTTAEGNKIACKLIEGKPRVSDRAI